MPEAARAATALWRERANFDLLGVDDDAAGFGALATDKAAP